MLKIFLVKNPEVKSDWDEGYHAFVVVAETDEAAREVNPRHSQLKWNGTDWEAPRGTGPECWYDRDWPAPEDVMVTLIGNAAEGQKEGIILISSRFT